MNALIVPTLGSVMVDDNVVTKKKQKNLKQIRQKVGVVFQFPEYQLFEETRPTCFLKPFNLLLFLF